MKLIRWIQRLELTFTGGYAFAVIIALIAYIVATVYALAQLWRFVLGR